MPAKPNFFMSERPKEPHYFAPEFQWPLWVKYNSMDAYLSLFEDVRDEKRVGEASVYYLASDGAARRIHEFDPDARIIAILRHPVEVMHSLFYPQRLSANETLARFEQALEAEANRKQGIGLVPRTQPRKLFYRDMARYSAQIQRYFDYFGREQVLVILFDDFVKDTARVYRHTLEFLGVDPDFQTEFVIYNQHKNVHYQTINRLLRQPSPALAQIGAPLDRVSPRPARVLWGHTRRLIRRWNIRLGTRPPIDPETRRELLVEMQTEIEQLSQVLGRDLSFWYES